MNLSQLHKPILLKETLKIFKENLDIEKNTFGIDATFGRGGHGSAILESFPNFKILGIDQDIEAIEYAKSEYKHYLVNERLELLHGNFSDTQRVQNLLKKDLDFVFFDIGVSSPQLDNANRGFSFYNDGPLDMRMNQSIGETAADIMNEKTSQELREIFLKYGEVYASDKLLEGIQEFRIKKKFETTLELANLIEKKCGWRKKGHHPATLYFQALRIYVNAELEKLRQALEFYTEKLRDEGVFIIISFHSLEDRMIKHYFRNSVLGKLIYKKVIKPTKQEELGNKRARSAKLRVFKKTKELL